MNPYKIAVPIIGPSMDDALRDIDHAAELNVDIIELRIDLIKKPNLERLLSSSEHSKIVTNRHKAEHGGFEGTEDERFAYLEQAAVLGAEYIDIELNYFRNIDMQSSILIVSYHDFEQTPANLDEIYWRIAEKNPDIIKIATKAQRHKDTMEMLKLIKYARQPIIGICMGELGKQTRVYGPIYGGYLTFASLPGKPSASGQLTVEELRECWKKV